MRIIAGTLKRRIFLGPPDEKTTRPISDRVKEALFNRLTQARAFGYGHAEQPGEDDAPPVVNALDIFAGTGTLGLESLSRGASHVVFVERDRGIRKLLEQNLRTFDLTDRATVQGVDILAADPATWVRTLPVRPFRIVTLDPPYAVSRDEQGMAKLTALAAALADVCEHGAVLTLRTEREVAGPAIAGWDGPDTRDYGTMALHMYYK
jgi:16S rRNA (guanine966-N2)-methyltransferase